MSKSLLFVLVSEEIPLANISEIIPTLETVLLLSKYVLSYNKFHKRC